MKTRGGFLSWLLPVCGILLFLLCPAQTAAGVREGLRISGRLLAPSLFPVSVLAGCLLLMGSPTRDGGLLQRILFRVFGFSGGCAAPLLLGLLGGFPLGAQLTAEACEQGMITRQEAERLAPLCNCAGPAFLIGTVGGVLGAPRFGLLLWAIQLVSGLMVCLPQSRRQTEPKPRAAAEQAPQRFFDVLPRAIERSALSMVRLTGTLCFFQALFACARVLLPDLQSAQPVRALLTGMFELTVGVRELDADRLRDAFPAAAALVCWSGFCVHLQSASALGTIGVKMKPYMGRKLLQAAIAWGLASLLSMGCSGAIKALSSGVLILSITIFFLFFKKSHWKTGRTVI